MTLLESIYISNLFRDKYFNSAGMLYMECSCVRVGGRRFQASQSRVRNGIATMAKSCVNKHFVIFSQTPLSLLVHITLLPRALNITLSCNSTNSVKLKYELTVHTYEYRHW